MSDDAEVVDIDESVLRDERGLLLPGTLVGWHQRGSGAAKDGIVVQGFHGLYGPSYLCRANRWNQKWTTTVVESDLTYFGGNVPQSREPK